MQGEREREKPMESITRRDFMGVAGMGVAGIAAMSIAAKGALAEEAAEATAGEAAEAGGEAVKYQTFNGGPLTAAEQHATITEYDWTANKLSVAEIAEAAKSVTDAEAQAILDNEPEITEDYVQEDGTVVPAVYIALRNRINRNGQGVGNEVKDGCWDFLMQEFAEDEAAFYLKLPMYRYFNDEEAGEAAGIPAAEAKEMCDSLSYRGLLNRVTRCGVSFYHTLAFAHGMLEFMMDRYEEDGFVAKAFGMLGADYSYQTRNQGSAMYFAIPVQQDIVGETTILPYNDWGSIIERNDVIAVSPCQCRTFTPIRSGEPLSCDHPLETCMSFGEQAQYYVENGIGRQIDKDEARSILQRSVDAGMVLQVMNTKQCDVICSCHGDCCAILSGYIAMEGDVENLKYVSNYDLVVDQDACIQCGACAERCPMFTITMDEETGYPVVGNLCVRCGQCATVCPAGARTLVARAEDDRVEIPYDMIDDYHVKALERAKRGYIVDFGA